MNSNIRGGVVKNDFGRLKATTGNVRERVSDFAFEHDGKKFIAATADVTVCINAHNVYPAEEYASRTAEKAQHALNTLDTIPASPEALKAAEALVARLRAKVTK